MIPPFRFFTDAWTDAAPPLEEAVDPAGGPRIAGIRRPVREAQAFSEICCRSTRFRCLRPGEDCLPSARWSSSFSPLK